MRLLVVDTGALDWRAMGVGPLNAQAFLEMGGGALWAIPVIGVTAIVSGVLLRLFPVTPVSPLPPTGDPVGFALSLLAGVIVAPFGEEILFRAFATTAWVRGLGYRRGLLTAALVFAFAHVLTVSGANAERRVRARRGRLRLAHPGRHRARLDLPPARDGLGVVRPPRRVQRDPLGPGRGGEPVALAGMSRGAPRVEPPVRARR